MADYEFTEVSDAADAIRDFVIINQDKLPAHLKDRLLGLTRTGSSPVDLVTMFVKAVYANRGKTGITNPAKKLAAAAADLIDMKGFHGRLDDRAGKMSLALLRDSNVQPPDGKAWPDKADDPDVDEDLLAPKPVVETPPPAPAEPPAP